MEFYHFTEFAWPYLPPDDEFTSMRVNLPSQVYDPEIGADWYDMCLDQHLLADDLGMNCMINEHHQTATCLNSAAPVGCYCGTADQKCSDLYPRQSFRQPSRPYSKRGRNGDDR